MMSFANLHESRYWLAAGGTMLHFIWIGGAVWIAAAAVRSLMSRSGPRVRYAVALGMLVATACIPCALLVVEVQGNGENVPALHRGSPAPSDAIASAAQPAVWPTRLAGRLEDLFYLPYRWLPWLWLTGTPMTLVALTCGVTGVERLRRAARLLDDGDTVTACRRLQAMLGVGRRVSIGLCDRIAAPLLVGILRPMILLPASILAECSTEQIEMILIHELAHVRRCDVFVNFVQRLLEAVLFFHPAIWWLSSWVRLEREKCCDGVVLAHTCRPQLYAETLAAIALPGIAARHAALAMTDCHLAVRIRHILNLDEESMNASRKSLLAAAGLLVIGAAVAFWQLYKSGPSGNGSAQKPPVVHKSGVDPNFDPTYRVESPDVLSIGLVKSIRADSNPIEPGDQLKIRGTNLLPIDPSGDPVENGFKQINGLHCVQPDGTIDLGPQYGSVVVTAMNTRSAREAIVKHLRESVGLVDPKIAVSLHDVHVQQIVAGEHLVRPDGTVAIGIYGKVPVRGLTVEEIKAAIEKHLAHFFYQPAVEISITRAAAR
ncbi:MAG: polysaccharide biosynthesis/export family protein [Planctomycetia bacterium]|nr:polysaccharide biosynthesis/export family protein [Planctomycetia bacterium]